MRTTSIFRCAVLVIALALLAGCATTRSEIGVDDPGESSTAQDRATGRTLAIASVTDNRVFEVEPEEPSTPSLGFGGSDDARAAVRARAVGRKRNGYGKALGDVLLEEGTTVADVVDEHLRAAAKDAGYRVVDADEDADVVVEASIERFWSWMDPGFATVKLTTVIDTELALDGGARTARIEARTHDGHGVVTDGTWKSSIERTLEKYRDKAAVRLDGID